MKGEETAPGLPSQIQAWKKALTEGPPASSAAARSGPALVARLYQEIGKLTVELNFLAGRSGLRERPVGGDNLFNLFRFLGPVDSCCKPGPQTALTVSVLGTGSSSINGPRTHCWYYNDSSSKKTADAACLTLSDLPREAFVSTLAGSVSPQESPYRTIRRRTIRDPGALNRRSFRRASAPPG